MIETIPPSKKYLSRLEPWVGSKQWLVQWQKLQQVNNNISVEITSSTCICSKLLIEDDFYPSISSHQLQESFSTSVPNARFDQLYFIRSDPGEFYRLHLRSTFAHFYTSIYSQCHCTWPPANLSFIVFDTELRAAISKEALVQNFCQSLRIVSDVGIQWQHN